MAQLVVAPESLSVVAKVAAGEIALDGAGGATVSVAGLLTSVVGVALTLKTSATPGLLDSILTYNVVGTTVNIYAWKVTAQGDTTLVAGSTTLVVGYAIFGS